jgi:uncharacterized membrane protein YqaE (UPF0057 family)
MHKSEENIYMILKNIMEKLKTVLSSALHQLQDELSSGMPSWKTVQSFIVYPLSAFIQRGFQPAAVPSRRLDELQLWNSFSYYPAITSWDILEAQSGKYIGKDKKWHWVNIYLLLTLHIQSLIY